MAAARPAVELSEADRTRVAELTAAAIADLDLRDHQSARDQAELAVEIDPGAVRAWAVLGRARQLAAGFEDPADLDALHRAEGELRIATRLAADDPFVARLHAELLRDLGHLTAAAQRAETGLEAAPTDPELAELAGTLRYDLGDERRAIPHFERALEQRPAAVGVLFRLGECRVAVARSAIDPDLRARAAESALRAFRQYVEHRPDDPDGHLGVALAISVSDADSADFDAALTALERAAALDATSARPDFNRGVILERAGDPAAAREAYAAALARDGDHLPSLLNLAANQAADGMADAARATCTRALELDLSRRERRRVEAYLRETAGGP